MIYLDYAANTPVEKEVLDEFYNATLKYIANPNSKHLLGLEARNKIEEISNNLASYFKCNSDGIIYTSGSSEANNLVIKGLIDLNKKDIKKKIIISSLEHSSIVAPCNYLASLGIDVSIISTTKDGIIDLEELEHEIDDNTVLVSIASVDSELGTIQPIEKIASIVHKHKNCLFHTDATQAIGKVEIDYSCCDFITFAPHKFNGLNGIGVLVNRNNTKLIPIIHGGMSTTIYRSGTPVTANILALGKAFSLAINNLKERYNYIKTLNDKLRKTFLEYDCIHINSPINSIPNTLNISLINRNTKGIIKKLEEKEIFLSTTTACSLDNAISKSVLNLTGSMELASNTIRISLSYLTTTSEIDIFISEFISLIKE